MDALAFMIEAEELGLLTDTPPRILPVAAKPKPARRGKKAARAKRQKVKS